MPLAEKEGQQARRRDERPHSCIRPGKAEDSGERRNVDRPDQQKGAQGQRGPHPRIAGNLVRQQRALAAAHVEDLPELPECEREERDRDRGLAIEVEPEPRHGERRERARGQQQPVDDDTPPLRAPQDRLVRTPRPTQEHLAIAFAHGEGERRKDVRDQVEVEDLERQDRQRQRGDDRQPHHEHLAEIAGQEIGDEAADVVENDPALVDGAHDRRERVVEKHHRRRLPRDVGAAPAHCDADVGLPQGRRVVDAVACHGDDLAGLLVGADERELLGRADARENSDRAEAVAVAVAKPLRIAADRDGILRIPEADRAADAARRDRMVAGNHHDTYAGVPACGDRIRHVGACRILEPGEAEKGQVGKRLSWHGAGIARREGEDTQTVATEFLDLLEPFGPDRVAQRLVAAGRGDACSLSQHALRRSLHGPDLRFAAGMQRRHHARLHVEGMLAKDRLALGQFPAKKAERASRAKQRKFHRIPRRLALFPSERGVVAENRHLQQPQCVFGNFAASRIAGRSVTAGTRFPGGRHEPSHRHAVFRKRSRLVRQDQRCRAERLDSRKPFHERILSRHAPHAARQRQRRDDRKAFGDRRYGERDRRFHHEQGILAGQDARDGDDRGQRQRHPDQFRRKPREALLERRAPCLRLLDQLRDAAEFGGKPRADDDAEAAPAGHDRSLVKHGVAIAERGAGGCRRRLLVGRDGFPGQRGLVGGQSRRFDELHVRGEPVARLDDHDVARHQAFGRHHPGMPAAAHAGAAGSERAKAFDRPCRLDFRHEPDQRVDREHGCDGCRFLPLAEHGGKRRCGREQEDDRALELVKGDAQGRSLASDGDRVRSEDPGAAFCFFLGKALRGHDAERRENALRRGGMGVFRYPCAMRREGGRRGIFWFGHAVPGSLPSCLDEAWGNRSCDDDGRAAGGADLCGPSQSLP